MTNQDLSTSIKCISCNNFYGNEIYNNNCSICFRSKKPLDNHDNTINNGINSENYYDTFINENKINDLHFRAIKMICNNFSVSSETDDISVELDREIMKLEFIRQPVRFSYQQAKELSDIVNLKMIFGRKIWQLHNLLCRRVVDYWNIKENEMPTGYCYFGNFSKHPNPTIENIKLEEINGPLTCFLREGEL